MDLTKLKHPTGVGTPLETMNAEACITCHMPGGLHLWRIKASNSYTTIPAGALNAVVNANTSPEGTFTNAVWVDVDLACGQCHGGGTNHATTAISGSSSATLTVASTNGFAVGSRIRIPGAGALEEDGVTREDFYGNVKTVTPPNTIVLLAASTISPVGKNLEQNPLRNGAHYRTKAELSIMAAGMHMDHAPSPNGILANFTASATALLVNVNASATTCSGAAANCDTYTWDFGDGSTATGVTQSHTFATAGTYVIELTVVDGVNQASTTRTMTIRAAGPLADGTCSFDDTSWTLSVTNTSTSANGLKFVAVDWNQGILTRDYTAPFDGPFVRQYPAPRQYKVYLRAVDKTGLSNRKLVCTMMPAQFTLWSITGTVRDAANVPVGGAKVELKGVGFNFLRNVYTAANGTYTAANLKPGTYLVTVTKTPLTFPAGVNVTVGASKVNDVNAQ
jgi:PKD repeat protein